MTAPLAWQSARVVYVSPLADGHLPPYQASLTAQFNDRLQGEELRQVWKTGSPLAGTPVDLRALGFMGQRPGMDDSRGLGECNAGFVAWE